MNVIASVARAVPRKIIGTGPVLRSIWLWRWILAAVTLVATLVVFALTLESGLDLARRQARQRLVITEAVLRAAVNRYEYLPSVLALDTQVQALLGAVDAPDRIATVNAKFEAIAATSHVSAIYLLDADGLTRGASNWNQPLSFIGASYAYRPYFTAAKATGASRYFGIGTTTGVPGLFIGKAVSQLDGRVAGVVVVKVDLEGLQSEWHAAGEQVLVSDAAGVVFLASEPAWKYRPFHTVGATEATRIRAERQYGDSTLKPLLTGETRDFTGVIDLPVGDRTVSGLVERVEVPDLSWMIWYVVPTGPALRQALLAALAAGIACLALAFALAARGQRQRRLQSEQAMRLALEQRVAERTQDLSAANDRLRGEIAERERATIALRATQDELIHAGRLAALGQISTAINHEINQPLAALRTFLASTGKFLERGDLATVGRNLERMTQVTQRIGEIIRHLKGFARKTGPEHRESVSLGSTAEAVLDLLQARIRSEGVTVTSAIPSEAFVQAEPVRLEQVLLNLIVNALDAMRDAPERLLHLAAEREADGPWRLSVADSGGGIAEEHMAQVFDPFFTTKTAGEGLGLGLSLSSLIVRDLGGSIAAANDERGAVLAIVLPAAKG